MYVFVNSGGNECVRSADKEAKSSVCVCVDEYDSSSLTVIYRARREQDLVIDSNAGYT